jgi:hypothetical protein
MREPEFFRMRARRLIFNLKSRRKIWRPINYFGAADAAPKEITVDIAKPFVSFFPS